MFLHVILSTGGACMVARGGMRGCSGGGGGACMVAWGTCMVAQGGGGMCGCSGGAFGCSQGRHAWLLGGMHSCSGGHVWLPGGAWLLQGGMHGCSWGVWLLLGGVHGIRRDTEIRSMSRWYASYWNAFLLSIMIICRSLLPTKIVRQKAKSNH